MIEQAKAQRLEWVKDRSGRRQGLVAELRQAESARSNLFAVLELHGKDAPNLGDLTLRLRALNDRIKKIEAALIDLEDEPIAPGDMPEIAPAVACETLRQVVLGCQDVRKLREFVGAFVESIQVTKGEVLVNYRPECIVRMHEGGAVRSESLWLPDLGSNQGPTD